MKRRTFNKTRIKSVRRTVSCPHCREEFDFEEFNESETWRVYETRIDC